MGKPSLHEFYLGLIPNLINDLLFFIPKDDIREDIIAKLDFLNTADVFNKIYVIDYYQGPIIYHKSRNNKYLLLKESHLDKTIFCLLEKKSAISSHEFKYVLEKYLELSEALFQLSNWMYTHVHKVVKTEDDVCGLFYLQSLNYKKHFDNLVKNFYPTKETNPNVNVNALELIETYFPEITKKHNTTQKPHTINQVNFEDANELSLKKNKKQPIITEAEAEFILLHQLFNVDIKNYHKNKNL